MNVAGIRVENFMRYRELDLQFPAKGLVLVIGKNGLGKSAFFESVSVAMFGETIRGTPPWRSGEAGSVKVWTSLDDEYRGVQVIREVGKTGKLKRVKVSQFSDGASGGEEYPTATKAQDAIDRLLGVDYEMWKACSVFRIRDVAAFTLATDSARKRRLEQMLGLSRFDEALRACRIDASAIEKKVSSLQLSISRYGDLEDREVEARNDAEDALEELRAKSATVVSDKVIEQLEAQIETLDAQRVRLYEDRAAALDPVTKARMALEQIERDREKFRGGICPTCSQPVKAKDKSVLDARAMQEGANLEQIEHDCNADKQRIDAEISRVNAELRAIKDRVEKLRGDRRVAQAHEKEIARWEGVRDRAAESIERLKSDRETSQVAMTELSQERAELEAVERVLSLKGVRSTILGGALESLELVANDVLERFDVTASGLEPIKIRLPPTRKLKNGEETDEISLEIEHVGGGYGYDAASGGQQRRIDVALLVAQAFMLDGVLGQTGDLWFDEVFDALDDDGVGALSEIIVELAERRKVVVISHNPRLLDLLSRRAAQVLELHAVDGWTEVERWKA